MCNDIDDIRSSVYTNDTYTISGYLSTSIASIIPSLLSSVAYTLVPSSGVTFSSSSQPYVCGASIRCTSPSNITCTNGGICIRSSPSLSTCSCPLGTTGYYCERLATLFLEGVTPRLQSIGTTSSNSNTDGAQVNMNGAVMIEGVLDVQADIILPVNGTRQSLLASLLTLDQQLAAAGA